MTWLDPRPEKPHVCLKPEARYQDIGRRWQCDGCPQVWIVGTHRDQRNEEYAVWQKTNTYTNYDG